MYYNVGSTGGIAGNHASSAAAALQRSSIAFGGRPALFGVVGVLMQHTPLLEVSFATGWHFVLT